jgi:hypothetical protein
MQILHIAMHGSSSSNQVMAMRTTKSRTHRDVFTLAASLGYTPKAVAGLRQKVADTDFTAQLEARRQSAGLTQAEVARPPARRTGLLSAGYWQLGRPIALNAGAARDYVVRGNLLAW